MAGSGGEASGNRSPVWVLGLKVSMSSFAVTEDMGWATSKGKGFIQKPSSCVW